MCKDIFWELEENGFSNIYYILNEKLLPIYYILNENLLPEFIINFSYGFPLLIIFVIKMVAMCPNLHIQNKCTSHHSLNEMNPNDCIILT